MFFLKKIASKELHDPFLIVNIRRNGLRTVAAEPIWYYIEINILRLFLYSLIQIIPI